MKRAEATRNCGAPRWYARVWMLALFMAPPMVAAAQVDTVAIYSAAMGKAAQAVVVLPERYLSSTERFPVVYLLHGWSGSYRDWPTKTDLKPLADRYEFIIVCPDGGYASWYLDSPLRKDSQYETYIAGEVPDYIDAHYRTIADSTGRFLCGLSMGGHGAFTLLAKYPHRFAGAGCMSGAMTLPAGARRAGLADVLGEYEQDPRLWEENSALFLATRLVGRPKAIFLDCGVDDFLLEANQQLHRRLLELKVEHEYLERPGGHTWAYWTNALEYHLLFFSKHMWR